MSEQEFQLPTPGEAHAKLQPFEGTFRAEVKIWSGSDEPMVSFGTMTNSWHLGGLYLHQDYVGDPQEDGAPGFAGKGYWGYNFASQKYEGFWIDIASSMMQIETGTVDESGKVWEMHSEFTHPANGQVMKKRSLIKLIDDDHHLMESYIVMPDGNEMKTMELSYTRVDS